MRTKSLFVALLPLLTFQTACELEDVFADASRFKEDFQYSHALKPGGTLSLENFNGAVELLGWEKDQVQITGTKYARSEEDLKALKIDTQATGDSVRIRTVRPSERYRGMGARYFIRVPRQVELERIATSNGSIRVEEIQGNCRLESSNGSLTLRRIRGRLQAGTSNASINGDDLEGEASLRTSNGSIRIEQMKGSLDASSSNAGVNVRISKPAPRQPLRLVSSNGSIELSLDAFEENEIRASTSNASITLRLPDSIKGRVRASTSNGSIHSDFDVLTKGIHKNLLEGDLGGGGPLIQVSTSNGTIRVLRR